MVRKSGFICLKLVDGSVCHNTPAESAKTSQSYVIYRTDDVNSGGSDTERPRCIWIQLVVPRNRILAVNTNGMTFEQNDCAQNDCWYCSKVSINGAPRILV
jgi:hypothetical protein